MGAQKAGSPMPAPIPLNPLAATPIIVAGFAVHSQCAAHCRKVAGKMPLPKSVAEDNHGRCVRTLIACRVEGASETATASQFAEEISSHEPHIKRSCRAFNGHAGAVDSDNCRKCPRMLAKERHFRIRHR